MLFYMVTVTKGNPNCDHKTHNYKEYLKMSFSPDDPILQESIRLGQELAKKVNPHDPSGKARTREVITRRCICGMLSELAIRYILCQAINDRKISASLRDLSTETEEIVNGNQIDILIQVNDIDYTIEVRSSFPYRSLNLVITKLFDVIGWYKTSNKSQEQPKDFYLRTLYNFPESEALEKIHNGIELYFVGGATRKILDDNGIWTNFKQNNATYRSIKPICATLDAKQIIDSIFT